jgi:hypothetical protein
MIVGWYVAETSGWMPLYREAPLRPACGVGGVDYLPVRVSRLVCPSMAHPMGEELKVARDDAVEANRLKDRFIATLTTRSARR